MSVFETAGTDALLRSAYIASKLTPSNLGVTSLEIRLDSSKRDHLPFEIQIAAGTYTAPVAVHWMSDLCIADFSQITHLQSIACTTCRSVRIPDHNTVRANTSFPSPTFVSACSFPPQHYAHGIALISAQRLESRVLSVVERTRGRAPVAAPNYHSHNRRGRRTSARQQRSVEAAINAHRNMGHESYHELYKDWYSSKEPLPSPWSCDWAEWDGIFMFKDDGYGTIVEDRFNAGFNIPSRIEPLAFLEGGLDDYFFFVADGKYYFDDSDDTLFRYETCGTRIFRNAPGQQDKPCKVITTEDDR
ncbi:hypothetical protein B0H10DRAFT_1950693 [Mycena sp. CBHHK59/15]|nr:hypothetical protein B0H10DRAFT_1950693 [Mycena sp. CBHHK59/15]